MESWLSKGDAETVRAFLASRSARMELYWILDKEGRPRRFKPNYAQETLLRDMHTRNNILKARQLGLSTCIALLILDGCLFAENFHAGIVDKTLDDAAAKLRKIRYAFEHLCDAGDEPDERGRALAEVGRMLQDHFEGTRFTESFITFPNGSRVDIGTSLRGGTLQLLHVSELGSVSMHDPQRAAEIVTGALNTVGKNCTVFFESTHEGGKSGQNYELVTAAMNNIGKELSPIDFKFFFFPWYEDSEYELEPAMYHPTAESERYFDSIAARRGRPLTDGQKAWYQSMKTVQKSKMAQEYPSTPEEAMNPVNDGTIYAGQLAFLREEGRLTARFEPDPHRPIYASWDIGVGDFTSIWWAQPDGAGKMLLLDCYTANNQPLRHYLDEVKKREARWGRLAACVTPHDGAKRDYNLVSFDESLRKAGWRVIGVPRTTDIWADIDATREFLMTCVIHERCSEGTRVGNVSYMSGVDALTNYRTLPAGTNGALRDAPLHDQSSHAADALRCLAVALKRGLLTLHKPMGAALKAGGGQSSFVKNFLS